MIRRLLSRAAVLTFLALLTGYGTPPTAAAAAPSSPAPRVVVTLKPLHALVAGVMKDVAAPELLLKGATSPHDYSLRPSDARLVSNADIVIWVGPALERFLEHPIGSLAGSARVVTLIDEAGLALLPTRAGGAWERHVHGDHDHAEHAHEDHGHEDHGHEDGDHDHHGHADAADDDHSAVDPHVWLSPENARRIVETVAAVLAEQDPDHRDAYLRNAARMKARLDNLQRELGKELAPVRNVPYIVFHDAYPYFEDSFGLNAVGSLTLSPERRPGARRIMEIREKIRQSGAACVFQEPQFEPGIVQTIVEGTGARTGVLDPIGADISAGEDAYFTLMRRLSASLVDCLSASSR